MKDSDRTMTRYLLGELADAEQAALEQKYFANPELFDQLVEAENDLVDRYARGRLSPETRRRFETYYLAHPHRRARAKFAEALAERTDRVEKASSVSPLGTESWWRRFMSSMQGPKLAWGFSLALLLLAVWFAFEMRRLHQEGLRNEAERATQGQRERDLRQQLTEELTRANQLADELNRLRSEPPPAAQSPTPTQSSASLFATLILNISGVRGAQIGPPATLNIPAGTEKARIQLNLSDNGYPAYTVVVQSADGRQVFKRDDLRSRNKTRVSLSIVIPASKLSDGDYILTLKGRAPSGGVEDVSKSLFRVSQNRLR
jgi:hypothetical protein